MLHYLSTGAKKPSDQKKRSYPQHWKTIKWLKALSICSFPSGRSFLFPTSFRRTAAGWSKVSQVYPDDPSLFLFGLDFINEEKKGEKLCEGNNYSLVYSHILQPNMRVLKTRPRRLRDRRTFEKNIYEDRQSSFLMISQESFVLICTICTVHLKKVHERWRKQQTMSSKSRKDAERGQNASNNVYSITHMLYFSWERIFHFQIIFLNWGGM